MTNEKNPQLKILKKLFQVQTEIGQMSKQGKNDFQNYNYLMEAQVTEKMKELFDKNGIFFCYSSKITGTHEVGTQMVTDVEVTYQFVDIESAEHVAGVACGQGADKGDKGVYKAITGAVKYIYMKTFNIPTGDDPEKDTNYDKKLPVINREENLEVSPVEDLSNDLGL